MGTFSGKHSRAVLVVLLALAGILGGVILFTGPSARALDIEAADSVEGGNDRAANAALTTGSEDPGQAENTPARSVTDGVSSWATFAEALASAYAMRVEGFNSPGKVAFLERQWSKYPAEIDGVSLLTPDDMFGIERAVQADVVARVLGPYARLLEKHGAFREWPPADEMDQAHGISIDDRAKLRYFPLQLPPTHLLASPLFGELDQSQVLQVKGLATQLHKKYAIDFARAFSERSALSSYLRPEVVGTSDPDWERQYAEALAAAESKIDGIHEAYLQELASAVGLQQPVSWEDLPPPLGPR